ncbi:hypothetical protein [Streptomyces sp. NPDC058045]|uniref:hypothetical protein n=1 Tax=Streptomyces sp. NPDC058045 TaxID=3346311 RepID=UPI0036ED82AD
MKIMRHDQTALCSYCRLPWEELTPVAAADPELRFDEYSVEGEPVCCTAAVAEFRSERGTTAGIRKSVKAEQTDLGWRVRWQEGRLLRARSFGTQQGADKFVQYLRQGGVA